MRTGRDVVSDLRIAETAIEIAELLGDLNAEKVDAELATAQAELAEVQYRVRVLVDLKFQLGHPGSHVNRLRELVTDPVFPPTS